MNYDIGPDPEAGDSLSEMQEEFLREQGALDDQWRRELLGQVDGEDRQEAEVIEDFSGVNSCDALRIIDGVKTQKDPFDEGWEAREAGKTEDDNPYAAIPTGHQDHWKQMDWQDGWRKKDNL